MMTISSISRAACRRSNFPPLQNIEPNEDDFETLADVEVVVNFISFEATTIRLSLNVDAFVEAFNKIGVDKDVAEGLVRYQERGIVHLHISRPPESVATIRESRAVGDKDHKARFAVYRENGGWNGKRRLQRETEVPGPARRTILRMGAPPPGSIQIPARILYWPDTKTTYSILD